jgi:hypothetical protein
MLSDYAPLNQTYAYSYIPPACHAGRSEKFHAKSEEEIPRVARNDRQVYLMLLQQCRSA